MTAQKLQTVHKNQPCRKVSRAIALDKQVAFPTHSGSSIYSYVSLKIEPCPLEDKYILIEEQINQREEVKRVIDMLEIVPYIHEAIYDFCSASAPSPIANVKITIMDTNYNLVDFKPFHYYECTHQLLEEIFKNV
ncbi:MAG: hypothetical protein MUE85_13465 [Microscillaceae bacterium]|jgi:hypothetical protein|nr:hypothetical protein [Microscillaceae bacterium]